MAIPGSKVRGQRIYYLNLSDRPTTLAFCVADKVTLNPCRKPDSLVSRFLMKPNQSLVMNVKKFPQKYFIVESSNPGQAILAEFAPATGTTKEFSSESSISFGEP
jgi:hypothetical protein